MNDLARELNQFSNKGIHKINKQTTDTHTVKTSYASNV